MDHLNTHGGVNQWRKLFQTCEYQTEISRIIFTGCKLQVFYSQIKGLKDLHLDNQCNNLYHEETNHYEEMQFSAHYS